MKNNLVAQLAAVTALQWPWAALSFQPSPSSTRAIRTASCSSEETFTTALAVTATIKESDERSRHELEAQEVFEDVDTLISPRVNRNRNVDRRRTLRRYVLAQKRRAVTEQEENVREREDVFLLLLALSPALLAFVSWEQVSLSLANFLDVYGAVGKAVDGNAFSNQLLRPTITGVIVPVISIALATLVSTTVNVLRDRQIQLRALVNKEACDLRLLRRAVLGMFGTRQHAGRRVRAFTLLEGYVRQIEGECQSGASDTLTEVELSGGIAVNELDRLSAMLHGVDGAAVSRQGSVGVADGILARLNGYRSDRVALILSVFPTIHWIVLAALSVFICISFLLESNQTVNQYLNSIQLRSLFAMLVGVFSATATLCLDLSDPFTGSFSIEVASTQLGDLQVCLREDVREAKAEAEAMEMSSGTRRLMQSILGSPSDESETPTSVDTFSSMSSAAVLDEDARRTLEQRGSGNKQNSNPSRYGLLSTVYFHLLTGPLGSNVRALAETAAWTITFLGKQTRALVAWMRWPLGRWRKDTQWRLKQN